MKKLFVLEKEYHAEEVEQIAESLGISLRRYKNLLIADEKVKDEDLLILFHEIDTDILKKMKIYEGNFREVCEEFIKIIPKAKPITTLLDKLIYDNLGKIFTETKILFHPIVSVKEKKVKAFEALCRPPIKIIDLISVGESTSEFSENFCRDRALNFASDKLPKDCMLFLNFHPRFLKDPLKNFGDFIASLHFHGIDPQRIVVELTEYEELEINAIKALISFLKSEGVKVALDDVGSGYSGLFYLSELKPDIIKIDMELIRNIDKHKLKKVIVNYLIRIAHESGILVVSEGVETKEELETVVYMGTDFVQGFIFSKPLENPNIEELNKKVKEILERM